MVEMLKEQKLMADAPWDQFVLLKVDSGVIYPQYDLVLCKRFSDGYHNGDWVTVQGDHLTESHTGEIYGWFSVGDCFLAPF